MDEWMNEGSNTNSKQSSINSKEIAMDKIKKEEEKKNPLKWGDLGSSSCSAP